MSPLLCLCNLCSYLLPALLLPCCFHFHFCFLFSSIIFGLTGLYCLYMELNMFACHDQNENKISKKENKKLQPSTSADFNRLCKFTTHTITPQARMRLAEPRPVRSGFTVNAAKELKHLQLTLEPAAAGTHRQRKRKKKKTTADGYVYIHNTGLSSDGSNSATLHLTARARRCGFPRGIFEGEGSTTERLRWRRVDRSSFYMRVAM